jgi:NADH-quinone oxidoreductase subunit H
MSLGWKWLIPAALANILVTGAVVVLAQHLGLVETIRTEAGERLVGLWPWGKLFLIAASLLVGVPVIWIVLAVINRRSADFNLRVQRQIRLPERGEEEVFAEV